MTVLVWDGTTLAADKMASGMGVPYKVTKIYQEWLRVDPNGALVSALVGGTGTCAVLAEMLAWIRAGAVPADFPETARKAENASQVVVITADRILLYEIGPYPLRIEDAQCAWGSGGDLARMAMHLGKSAKQAVKLVCALEPTTCGNGVDTLTLEQAA